ncbi:Hypothetical predicted protein [Marmota monax]|uniref:Small subunit of serine palmitoyltransferase A n=1 Tax=Marmota monax TaxID=9995 RepID=A0A5E4AVZ0_MARMO|nr:hypothetical protein GHT09_017354 [Marmota monax]VTJ61568.1 Hypothetical predicted protein [Marmota monax]
MALARAWKQMSWFYYQYLLVTALYMLEPWERTVFSILPGPLEREPGWGAGLILPGPGLGVGGGEAGSAGDSFPRRGLGVVVAWRSGTVLARLRKGKNS